MTEVVALFNSRSEAEEAVDRVTSLGYDVKDVGYVDRYRDDHGNIVTEPGFFEDSGYLDGERDDEATKGAAGGAVGGAAVGVGAGLLASAGLLIVPGIGPFLAAGTLAGTLAATAVGAAGGAVIGGAAGAIFGEPGEHDYADHETSKHFREGVAQGSALVAVEANADETAEVAEQLRALGAHRVDIYGDEGWL